MRRRSRERRCAGPAGAHRWRGLRRQEAAGGRPAPPPPPPPAATARRGRPPPPEPVAEPTLVPPEPVARRLASRRRRSTTSTATRRCKPVFFELRQQRALAGRRRRRSTRTPRVLKQYPTWTVTIEGHCDERGTAEYNLALGERRAVAARAYLVVARHPGRPAPDGQLRQGISVRSGPRRSARARRTAARISSSPRK